MKQTKKIACVQSKRRKKLSPHTIDTKQKGASEMDKSLHFFFAYRDLTERIKVELRQRKGKLKENKRELALPLSRWSKPTTPGQ